VLSAKFFKFIFLNKEHVTL